MRLDEQHNEIEGQLLDISFSNDDRSRATVTFISEREDKEDLVFEDYKCYRFATTQILKFAELRKSDLTKTLTDDEGEEYTVFRDNASKMVLDGIEEDSLVFKFRQGTDKYPDHNGELVAVVSTRYATVPSDELDDLVNQTLGEMGISGDDMTRRVQRRGYVVEMDYSWDSAHEVEDVGETIDGGISIRNSVFGASSLRVGKFYTILACQNGMKVRNTERELRQIHMGDSQALREAFVEELEAQIESIWEETELIQEVATIQFDFEEQIRFFRKLAENRKITKKSAGIIVGHIVNENDLDVADYEDAIGDLSVPEVVQGEWNVGRQSAWNMVNGMTGYTTHESEVSHSSRKKIERVYDNILKAENRQEVLAIAD